MLFQKNLHTPQFMNIFELFSANTDILWAAIVSAVVSAAVSYYFKRRETRDTLVAQFEHEERKRIRALIGLYHGRLVRAGFNLSNRMWNLYDNHQKGWLDAGQKYEHPGHYLSTTVYRFLHVCTLARQFERESLFLDARIARPNDFLFMNYLNAFSWALTEVRLFQGLSYDPTYATSHFFADKLRSVCDSCWIDKDFLSLDSFEQRIEHDRSVDAVFRFFDSLAPNGPRMASLRWDRLVLLHLLLVCFLDTFGYTTQRLSREALKRLLAQFCNRAVLTNALECLPELGLKPSTQARRFRKALVTGLTAR
jgi:hypothetical protein